MKNLPRRLIQLRKSLKLSQNDVAQHLGINRASYAFYEQGRNLPTIENLVKLTKLYNTTADYILGIDQEKKHLEEIILLNKILKLNDNNKYTIQSLIDFFIHLESNNN